MDDNKAIPGDQGALGIHGCYEKAKSLGNRVFAVQQSGTCYTTSTARNTYKQYGLGGDSEFAGCSDPIFTGYMNAVYEIRNGN